MAWLQNLAGRAEDLLNKIDQNAANVLHETTPKEMETERNSQQSNLEETPRREQLEIQIDNKPIKTLSRSDSAVSEEALREVQFPGQAELESGYIAAIFNPEPSPTNIDSSYEVMSTKSAKDELSKSSSMNNSFVLADDSPNYIEKIAKLEAENQEFSSQLLNTQHSYLELRNENATLQTELKASEKLVADLNLEMDMYRARAHKVLNEMTSLKNNSASQDKTSDDSEIYLAQNKSLREKVEFEQKRNEELSEKLKKTSNELLYLQQQFNYMQNSWQQNNKALENTIGNEKKFRALAEEECKIKTQELQSRIEELIKVNNEIEQRDRTIQHLQKSLQYLKSSQLNEDLGSRLESLTETLMAKQSVLETVTTERNALRLQLEKVEKEYQNKLSLIQKSQAQVITMHDTEDLIISQVPRFMRLSPMDVGVTMRVKRAYSTLDAISIRTGVFLRRYPAVRVGVFCYMIILQIWVLFILFLSAPSSH